MLGFLKKKYQTLNTIRVFEADLVNNLNTYKKLFPSKMICPVLKSNAYGHGLVLVAKALEKQKPEFLIVDSLYEAYELKKAGIKSQILILGYTNPQNLIGKKFSYHFAMSNLEEIKILAKIKAKVHLEIDTGMNRMGFTIEELKKNLKEIKKLKIEGVFTHLCDADNPENNFTMKQINKFKEALKILNENGIEPKWIHAAASGGALKADLSEFNMIRLGLGLYGLNPYQKSDPYYKKLKKLRPAMQVSSTIIQVRDLKKGDKVSYSCTFTAPKKMRVAVLPFGYYEGIPISLSNKWKICGRVCMNHTIIDITGKKLVIGNEFIVYSKNPQDKNSIENLAKLAGTIQYELIVKLSGSIRREINNF